MNERLDFVTYIQPIKAVSALIMREMGDQFSWVWVTFIHARPPLGGHKNVQGLPDSP